MITESKGLDKDGYETTTPFKIIGGNTVTLFEIVKNFIKSTITTTTTETTPYRRNQRAERAHRKQLEQPHKPLVTGDCVSFSATKDKATGEGIAVQYSCGKSGNIVIQRTLISGDHNKGTVGKHITRAPHNCDKLA